MPKAISEREKELRGSAAKRKTHPRVARNLPRAPKWRDLLGDEQAARDAARWWRETVPELDRAGILSRVDEALVVECATCVARIAQCEREIGRTGLLIPGQKGNLVRNPLSISLATYRSALAGYIKALGLSPQSRQGMDVAGPPRQVSQLDAVRIVGECSRRGISLDAAALVGTDPTDLDLAGVPADIAAKYGSR